MKIAVTVAVYNEEKCIESFIKALISQTKIPDEIIIVDDGSKDRTSEILERYAKKNKLIRLIKQQNTGPAKARNRAWRASSADICVFTDGDCVPENTWIENIIRPFSDPKVGAVGGTYKTINDEFLLAKFVGLEIEWKYKDVHDSVDAHGTYNLAVRKSVLEEVGGMSEEYPKPSGEDWDMTYKISRKYKISYMPSAKVGTYHPEDFIWYMKNQVRRGFDRIKLYNEHPDKVMGDVYTPWIVKFQVPAAVVFVPSLILLMPMFGYLGLVPVFVLFFLLISSSLPFFYFVRRDVRVALISIPIQFCRTFAWAWGMINGCLKFGAFEIVKAYFIR